MLSVPFASVFYIFNRLPSYYHSYWDLRVLCKALGSGHIQENISKKNPSSAAGSVAVKTVEIIDALSTANALHKYGLGNSNIRFDIGG